MRAALILGLALASGCAPHDSCFEPRSLDESNCEVVELNGSQWDLHSNQPIERLDSLCSAACIDVPGGVVSVAGYDDLRKVPLLAKMRTIHRLAIDVEGLVDLRGLEHLDITLSLDLSTHGGDLTSFASLDGLEDRDVGEVAFKQLLGLAEFDGARFSRLDYFSAEDCALRRVDLSSLRPKYVYLNGLSELRELALGGGTMDQLGLTSSSILAGFSWQPDLKLRSYNIQNNRALSSCLVQDFIDATYVPPGVRLSSNNGPCP